MSPKKYDCGTLSVTDYLRYEKTSHIRHEYVEGELIAMTGGTLGHNHIAVNLSVFIQSRLAGTQCRAYMSDVKVRVEASNCFFYPDLIVSCEATSPENVYLIAPVLIAEVLSPSTARVDQLEKLVNYKKIPSLIEYLIVHHRKRRVDVYQKVDETWLRHSFSGDEIITLRSISLDLPLSAIYAGLNLPHQVKEDELDYLLDD